MTTSLYKDTGFNELRQRTIQWASDRGIIEQGTALGQSEKVLEEAQELVDATIVKDKAEQIDAVGDVLVSLTNFCALEKIDMAMAWDKALKVIEGRKGRMVDGKFVKEN